jgi:hypothetical protein
MAVRYPLSSFTEKEIDNIIEQLTIYPIDETEEKFKQKGKVYKTRDVKDGVTMFIADQQTQTITLPYRFFLMLKNQNPNLDRDRLPENTEFIGQLRPYQIEVINEAYPQFKRYRSVSLCVPPGKGKTIMAAHLIYIVNTGGNIIFFTRENIGDGWESTFSEHLPNLTVWYVGEKNKWFKKNETPARKPDIILCMNERWQRIPSEWRDRTGVTVIDEAHQFCTKDNINCLLSTQPKYLILLSATLHRETDSMERMVQSMAGIHGVFRDPDTPYFFYRLNTGVEVQEERNSRGLDAQKLYKALCENDIRNNIIINIVERNPHRKFMLLTKTHQHVKTLSQLLKGKNIQHDTLFGSKRSYHDSFCLIGTMPKMGTGFDEARACEDFQGHESNVLIFCCSVKQQGLFEQVKGRVMRCAAKNIKPAVIWLNDKNKMSKNHFYGLKNWIEKTQGEVIDCDISNITLPPI